MNLKTSQFKIFYKLHVYAGLFVAIHFVLLALSGLVLLFRAEIEGEAPASEASAIEIPSSYANALATLKTLHPRDRPLALFPDEDRPHVLHARLGIEGATKLRGARKLTLDLTTGQELGTVPEKTSSFFDWTLRLHRELFLGSYGKLYVGFVGFAYVFLLISGFVIYGKFMRGRSWGDIRANLSLADIHKFVGVTTFGWALVVGASGTMLAFNGVLIKAFQSQSLSHLTERYTTSNNSEADFQKIVSAVTLAKPDGRITYVSFPDTEFGIPGHHLFLVNGKEGPGERLSELVVVDSQTARLVETIDLPLYLKAVLLSEPLHFGDYGGILLKIVWALFTVGSLAVSALGVVSHWKKRRKKPAKARASKRFAPGPPYRGPIAIAALTVSALALALVTEGLVARLAVVTLLVPSSYLLFHWRPLR